MSQRPRGGVLRARFPFPRETMLFEAGFKGPSPARGCFVIFHTVLIDFPGIFRSSNLNYPFLAKRGYSIVRFFPFSFSRKRD